MPAERSAGTRKSIEWKTAGLNYVDLWDRATFTAPIQTQSLTNQMYDKRNDHLGAPYLPVYLQMEHRLGGFHEPRRFRNSP